MCHFLLRTAFEGRQCCNILKLYKNALVNAVFSNTNDESPKNKYNTFMDEKNFHSGFAVLAGLPNAGKSTLLNHLAGGCCHPSLINPKLRAKTFWPLARGTATKWYLWIRPAFWTRAISSSKLCLTPWTAP